MPNLTRTKSFCFHARSPSRAFLRIRLWDIQANSAGFMPPWRRELRIAMSCLLFGGIAGALCVSGVAPRPSDRAAMKVAEAPPAMASQEAASQEVGSGSIPRADARAASSEGHAGTAARPQASADVSVRKSSETSAPDVAPQSAIAPKPRTVRIRKEVDSPAIARLPLGRSEAPAAAPPPGDAHELTQASNAAPAGSDVPAVASEKAGVRPGREGGRRQFHAAKEGAKDGSHCQLSARHRERFPSGRGERTDDWSTRPAAPASADVPGARPEKVVTRRGARESIVDPSPPKTARNASSRRDDARNDSHGVTIGKMIGALAPPSMMDAPGPIVRMRARPRRPTEDFGTGHDNIPSATRCRVGADREPDVTIASACARTGCGN